MAEFNDIWRVEGYEWKDGARGKYLSIKYKGSQDKIGYSNIFDPEQQDLMIQSKEDGLVVSVLADRSGRWVNVKEVKLVKDEIEKLPEGKDETPKYEPPRETPKTPSKEPSGQETGMWWKELGEMIRAGDIDKTKPEGRLMRNAYYAQMMSVLNLKISKE